MTATATTLPARDWVLALLRRDAVPPPSDTASILALCAAEDVTALVAASARRHMDYAAWPAALRSALASAERAAAARELARRAEIVRALDALSAAGVAPVLLKGTPLAYTIYDAPSHRDRDDTDVLVPPDAVPAARAALRALGYTEPPYSAGKELFGQAPFVYRDRAGMAHWLDVHWALSTARVFAETLTHAEALELSIPVSALGPGARTLCVPHALLLACMHPVMHHRNTERLAWTWDTHLLASRLDEAGWASFVAMVRAKHLRDIARQGLDRARASFGTAVPAAVIAAIAAGGASEATAAYLAPGRGWLDEVGANLKSRSWGARLRLLREIMFPAPAFVFGSYGVAASASRWLLLPFLYAHRGARGAWRLARGQK